MRLLSVPSLDLGIVPMYLSLANGACISLDSFVSSLAPLLFDPRT